MRVILKMSLEADLTELHFACRLQFSGDCEDQDKAGAGHRGPLHAVAMERFRFCELQHRVMALWASYFQSCPACLLGRYRPFQTLALSTTETSIALQNGAVQRPWEREPLTPTLPRHGLTPSPATM